MVHAGANQHTIAVAVHRLHDALLLAQTFGVRSEVKRDGFPDLGADAGGFLGQGLNRRCAPEGGDEFTLKAGLLLGLNQAGLACSMRRFARVRVAIEAMMLAMVVDGVFL